ncbi:MAG: hypothetical protein M1834_008231 [Cirrosporium novae-zelandiae]|nr:MAG: hypothetical protein M1834_008231 [Cirrosporium novae-zelandiae]
MNNSRSTRRERRQQLSTHLVTWPPQPPPNMESDEFPSLVGTTNKPTNTSKVAISKLLDNKPQPEGIGAAITAPNVSDSKSSQIIIQVPAHHPIDSHSSKKTPNARGSTKPPGTKLADTTIVVPKLTDNKIADVADTSNTKTPTSWKKKNKKRRGNQAERKKMNAELQQALLNPPSTQKLPVLQPHLPTELNTSGNSKPAPSPTVPDSSRKALLSPFTEVTADNRMKFSNHGDLNKHKQPAVDSLALTTLGRPNLTPAENHGPGLFAYPFMNGELSGTPPTGPHQPSFNPNTHSATNNPSSRYLAYREQSRPRYIDRSVDRPAQVQYLRHEIKTVLSMAQAPERELEMKERLRQRLERIILGALDKAVRELQSPDDFDVNDYSLACYGSLANGFANKGADMDLALSGPKLPLRKANGGLFSIINDAPSIIEKRLLDLGYGARLLVKTKCPIIRFCEKPGEELLEALQNNRFHRERRDKSTSDQYTDSKQSPANYGAKPLLKMTPSAWKELNSKKLVESICAVQGLAVDSPPRTPVRSPGTIVKGGSPLDIDSPENIQNFLEAVKARSNRNPQQHLQHTPPTESTKPDPGNQVQPSLNDTTYRPEPSKAELEYPKLGVGIQCDINVDNDLGIYNSKLLACYCECDCRVGQLGRFIKVWVKQRKINSAYDGSLCSYGYTLMVIHFLMNVADPPVIPNLQNIDPTPLGSSFSHFQAGDIHMQFWADRHKIRKAARRGTITPNTQSVADLLCDFFEYYAQLSYRTIGGGFRWTQDVISLRTPGGLLSKQMKGWTGARNDDKGNRLRYLLAIEDPFETSHNVARTVCHRGIVAIREEFRRARGLVMFVGNNPKAIGISGLCVEYTGDRTNLQRPIPIRPFVSEEILPARSNDEAPMASEPANQAHIANQGDNNHGSPVLQGGSDIAVDGDDADIDEGDEDCDACSVSSMDVQTEGGYQDTPGTSTAPDEGLKGWMEELPGLADESAIA